MADRILGVLALALALTMAWMAQAYQAEFSYEPVGPRAFPLLLAALLALAGMWLAVRPGRAAQPAAWRPAPALLLVVAAMVAYALLFQTLGFVLATTLMALPVGRSFGGRMLPALAAGAGLGLGLYFLFDKLFDVILPTGVLAFVLGGR
ncbi:tripartite tricarboxylate transporter TctB family protein [Pulveribacter sp.]|uniref:tripartite tricarboxylate transporter TctB family protein n=1 Tax=Pulveribacter sp. TaxID=2678893 RepID=UPI0028AC1071|nr:tripartite tricarboxylate transporter TctB family protein [Pulveribacter sp.]